MIFGEHNSFKRQALVLIHPVYLRQGSRPLKSGGHSFSMLSTVLFPARVCFPCHTCASTNSICSLLPNMKSFHIDSESSVGTLSKEQRAKYRVSQKNAPTFENS